MENSVKRTARQWSYTPELDIKKFFLSTLKSAVSASCGNFENSALGGVEMLEAIGFKKTQDNWEDEAWLLIMTAISKSMTHLARENSDLFPENFELNSAGVELAVSSFEDAEIKINIDFVEQPEKIEIIQPATIAFQKLLETAGVKQLYAQHIADRLSQQFVLGLRQEWVENPEKYKLLRVALETPFDNAIRKKEQWQAYLAYLQTLSTERVFDAPFGLDKVYIPLRGYFTIVPEKRNKKEPKPQKPQKKPLRTAFYLQKKISEWLVSDDKLLFIKGEPGCGKSSFAKTLSGHLAKNEQKTIFVQLQHFDIESNFNRSIEEYLYTQGWFKRDSDILQDNVVLILDGLDEISEAGNIGKSAAADFFGYLERFINNKTNIKAIITGRNLAIEAVSGRTIDHKNVITILGYYIPPNKRKKFDEESQAIINIDQRIAWWHKFHTLYEDNNYRYVDLLNNKTLHEVSSQPLLNYLLAISTNSKIEITNETNTNKIYKHLFDEVYDKNFSISKYKDINISREDFNNLLKEIAICAWQEGEVRITSWEKVKNRCNSNDILRPVINELEVCVREPHTKLLVAFYFGAAGRDSYGEKAFEFTHKSFGEFFAAQRIVDELKRLQQAGDLYSNEDFISKWVKMFGPSPIDIDLLDFIKREIGQHEIQTIKQWQELLIKKINFTLEHNIPKSSLTDCNTFKSGRTYARNAEEALFVILNACSAHTKLISEITWPNINSFGDLIRRTQEQQFTPRKNTLIECLSYLDISNQNIERLDLYGANLKNSNLENTSASYCILANADLTSCNLDASVLSFANLQNSKLENVELYNTDINNAYLIDTELTPSQYDCAAADSAFIEHYSYMYDYDIEERIRDMFLVGADLRGLDLSQANLQGANLFAANLDGANLDSANLWGANLNNTNLTNADLRNAKLKNTEFDINK